MLAPADSTAPHIAAEPIDPEAVLLDNGLWGTKVVLPSTLEHSSAQVEPSHETSVTNHFQESIQKTLTHMYAHFNEYKDSSRFLSQLSSLEFLSGKVNDAIKNLRHANSISGDPYIKEKLAEFLLRSGDEIEAREIYLSLTHNEPSINSLLRLAEIEIRAGNISGAKHYATEALDVDPLEWRALLFAGTLSLIEGNATQAIRCFRSAKEDRPNNPVVLLNLGIAFLTASLPRKALYALRQSVHLDPTNKKALAIFADLSVEQKRLEPEVELFLNEYLALEEDNDIVARLAELLYNQNRMSEGRTLLQRNVKRTNDPISWNNLGVLESKNHFRRAVECYQTAIKYHNQNTLFANIARANLIQLLIRNERFRDAYDLAFDLVNSIDPKEIVEDERVWGIPRGYMEVAFRLGHPEPALRYAIELLDTLTLHPLLIADLCAYLTTYFSLSHESQDLDIAENYARRAYDQIEKIEKKDPEREATASNNLAYVLTEKGKIDEALAVLNSVDLQNLNIAYATRGLISIRRGLVERGKLLYERAIEMTSDNRLKELLRIKLSLELAKFYLQKGEVSRSKSLLKRVLKRAKKDPDWRLPIFINEAQSLTSQVETRSPR